MNSKPSYLKPLRITVDAAVFKIGEVYPCCGSIRVQGWCDAPSRPVGFAACKEFAERMGVKSIGGYCDVKTDAEAVSFPFSFDMQPQLTASCRREEMSEALARVMTALRSAKRYFGKPRVSQPSAKIPT